MHLTSFWIKHVPGISEGILYRHDYTWISQQTWHCSCGGYEKGIKEGQMSTDRAR